MNATLAIDIGGTKTLAALVDGATLLEQREVTTARSDSPAQWCSTIAALAGSWRGRYRTVGVAVTGYIKNGGWTSLNPAILPVPAGFPLAHELQSRLAAPVVCVNDAHAAAWGEYRHGAGRDGGDMVFVTISTGVGGGAVVNGKILEGANGLGCSAGQMMTGAWTELERLEDQCAGQWLSRAARSSGHDADARGVFAAAHDGESWAEALIAEASLRIAVLLRNLHLLFDPKRFVIGGGIGLAPGFIERLAHSNADLASDLQPHLVPAQLGHFAGVVGASDLAHQRFAT